MVGYESVGDSMIASAEECLDESDFDTLFDQPLVVSLITSWYVLVPVRVTVAVIVSPALTELL
jgi:hypothetical protein